LKSTSCVDDDNCVDEDEDVALVLVLVGATRVGVAFWRFGNDCKLGLDDDKRPVPVAC
jgi:hypothetical protein